MCRSCLSTLYVSTLYPLGCTFPFHVFQGYERETAPNLRSLAEDGVWFEMVGAQSSHALVSLKSSFTGKYPSSLMLEENSADLVVLASLDAPREYLVRTFVGVRL